MSWIKILLGVVVVLVLVGFGEEVKSSWDARRFRGEGRFTVITIGEQVVVESVDPKTGSGSKLVVPKDLQVKTLKQRGSWKADVLFRLAVKYGWKWAGDSIADYLGITYTAVDRQLTVWDKLNWWNLTRRTKWQEVELGETAGVVEETAADGVKILGLSDRWRDKARELFYSASLASSGTEVRVFNATGLAGLAAAAATTLDSAGVRVVQVDESTAKVDNCSVVAAPEIKKSELVMWLARTFGCEVEEDTSRGKIVDLVLGEAYARERVGDESEVSRPGWAGE